MIRYFEDDKRVSRMIGSEDRENIQTWIWYIKWTEDKLMEFTEEEKKNKYGMERFPVWWHHTRLQQKETEREGNVKDLRVIINEKLDDENHMRRTTVLSR